MKERRAESPCAGHLHAVELVQAATARPKVQLEAPEACRLSWGVGQRFDILGNGRWSVVQHAAAANMPNATGLWALGKCECTQYYT